MLGDTVSDTKQACVEKVGGVRRGREPPGSTGKRPQTTRETEKSTGGKAYIEYLELWKLMPEE